MYGKGQFSKIKESIYNIPIEAAFFNGDFESTIFKDFIDFLFDSFNFWTSFHYCKTIIFIKLD